MTYGKLSLNESLAHTSADDCKSSLDNYERTLPPEKMIALCCSVRIYMDKRCLYEGYATKRRHVDAALKRAIKRYERRGSQAVCK